MKALTHLFYIFLFCPVLAVAQAEYQNYAEFYASQKHIVFVPNSGVEPSSQGTLIGDASNERHYYWDGIYVGKQTQIELTKTTLTIHFANKKNKVFNFTEALSLNAERVSRIEGATLYFHKGLSRQDDWLCLEGTPAGANGKYGGRYNEVYLIQNPFGRNRKNNFYKLPSLFASCLSVTHDEAGNMIFPFVKYSDVELGADSPGIVFNFYAIKQRSFVDTGRKIEARFIEPGNVYRFVIDVESAKN